MPAGPDLPLRIILIAPPPGVLYCLQRGRDERVDPVRSDSGDVTFNLTVQVKPDVPDLRGPFVQGPRGERFIYVRVGTLAGDADSPWTGRLKVSLKGITEALIEEARSDPAAVLAARVAGTAPNGSPACASVPLLNGGWQVIRG